MERKTENGKEHGRIKSLANSVPASEAFKNMAPEMKAKCEKDLKEKQKIIKARYLHSRGNSSDQLQKLQMPYCHGAGFPLEVWEFHHNEVYEVWKGLVDQVNENKGLAKRSEILDAQGVPTKKDNGYEKFHSFVPVTF